ncbi:MAG: hypothetical protein HC781_16720 [Leptolyngbyaceae cyanobacterium CSU_1_4]|nr:hypothetical protein [Leptolyngbyaceae cyanobacterium CSU_1_4]
MTDPARDAASVIDLLTRYSFDLSGYTVDRLAQYWLQRYPSDWIRLAVVEALYQGRYKAVSVEQILNLWQRRGKPLHHFNRDFERIIAPQFAKRTLPPEVIVPAPYVPPPLELELNTLELDLLELDALKNLELPQPLTVSRPVGAIQPFSVPDILLPKDTMFERFYAQLIASGELHPFQAAEPREAISEASLKNASLESEPLENESLEAGAPVATEPEPLLLPEPTIAEMKGEIKSEVDPARGLPIQPFKPSGDETLIDSLEVTPQAKDSASPPIHQFVPTLAPSEFYAKLKAIVQNVKSSRSGKSSGSVEPISPSEPFEPPQP